MAFYYPPVGFHFKVEISGATGMNTDTEQRFQEVSGLSVEIETEVLKEGGENRFEYKLPRRTKYPNLVLKRGLLRESAFISWFKDAINAFYSVNPFDSFKPADITITLLDEADLPVAIWQVMQAYPVKWSMTDLRSSENAVVIETMELAYLYFDRKL